MQFTDASGVGIAYQVSGSGQPTTCFLPGLTQSQADVRPFGSGVDGSRAFMDLRGQGASQAPSADRPADWTFDALVGDLNAVADEVGASRAVGVSAGAAVLLASMTRDPSRFDRLVLALPSIVDEARSPDELAVTDRLADAVAANDPIETARLLLELQPQPLRSTPPLQIWARRHAAELVGTPVDHLIRALPRLVPVSDVSLLRAVDQPVLVLAQAGDPAHPVAVAERVCEVLPNATLLVSDEAWIWRARTRLRDVVCGFLDQ